MFTSKSTKLLAIAIATLASICAAVSPSSPTGCLSLRSSQSCPGFGQEFISTNATKRFSWYPKDSVEAFDKALLDYISGQANLDEFQSVFRCAKLDDLGGFNSDHGKAVIQYHRSIICTDLIFGEDNLNACYSNSNNNNVGSKRIRRRDDNKNTNNDDKTPEFQLLELLASSSATPAPPSQPMPLCRSTCDAWIDSLHSIVSNSTLCQENPGINREASLDSLRGKCKSVPYNGKPGHCVQGDDNEPETCGYQRVEDWCKYCRYAINYYDTCASVGVQVGRSSTNGGSNGGSRLPAIPGINSTPPYSHILSKLRNEKRQERVFRIVAIVLSVIVGLCLIVLIVILMFVNRKPLPGLLLSKRGLHSSTSHGDGRDSKDDSTLHQLGGEGQIATEKDGDFVDYFINVVGKPRQVIRHFFARRDDEISLHQGDTVTLQMAFDDGWVVGKNLTTGAEGTFPLMCVMDKLPATVPAQWSVLPESGGMSSENLRRPSRAVTRPESVHGADGVLGGNVSRMSNLSNSNIPPTAAGAPTKFPRSPYLRSTRSASNSHSLLGNVGGLAETEKASKGWAILERLRGAFAPSTPNSIVSTSGSSASAPSFFKRLVTASPLGKEKPPFMPEVLAPKPGRPHSFNVNHVVHVGLTDPNYPRHGDPNTSVSTFPSTTRQSANGYPMIVDRNSGSSRIRAQVTQQQPQPLQPQPPQQPIPGFPRQPNFSYGEFAPSINSQITAGNASAETYHTAELFAQSNVSQNNAFGVSGMSSHR
ncbi:hypothetical protein GGI11_004957 [Coemansia sp. RSA 2049]|nr:hypothetical protein GGI11_004957 [Coemansia sp. RSA 2049]